MQSSIRVDRNVPMEMRDGTILRADICRPDDNQKHPAILISTPYNKTNRMDGEGAGFFSPIKSAIAGYARIFQDVRGRFASGGEYRFSRDRTQGMYDGYDTVEWIASQPWCDSNVGMMGGSAEAGTQYTTAISNPPHLKAIAPDVGGCSRIIEQALFGGPMYLSFLASWSIFMGIDIADKLERQGKDVSRMRKLLEEAISNPEVVYNFLPLKDVPQFQLEGVREIWNELVLNFNPTDDPGEALFLPYNQFRTACLHVGGWFDVSTWGTFKNFLGMRESGGSQFARENQHILMGPWKHGAQTTSWLAELDFGSDAAVPGGFNGRESVTTKMHLDFFNKHLRGADVEIPAVRYFVMGKNEWRNAETWPVPGTQRQMFFLHSKGKANTSNGNGLLSRDEPRSESPDIFVYDPHSPVPTVGGRLIPGSMGGQIPGPRDQIYVERRSDVLCYTTPELKEDTEITGPLEFHLFAVTSARDTDFTVKLVDVYPDSRAYVIADGVIRARYRKSIFKPELVTPGEVNEYTINMGCTSNCFKKGHRIRIDISSSNFPAWERNMNTGNPVGEDARGISAKQTIYHQPGWASYIDLPVIVS